MRLANPCVLPRRRRGKTGLINIEREANLSGSFHDKGMQIIAGYLRNKFAQDKPLSLAASICFEQSYSGVDGDSASSTEIYALLSALSGLPIRQDIAVTGSVSQQGDVQPIGGVNQKIEGFFDVCRVKTGLTGRGEIPYPPRCQGGRRNRDPNRRQGGMLRRPWDVRARHSVRPSGQASSRNGYHPQELRMTLQKNRKKAA
jgi:hypothetical protein